MDSEVVIPGHIWALELPEPRYGPVSPPLSHLHHDPVFVNAARGKKDEFGKALRQSSQ